MDFCCFDEALPHNIETDSKKAASQLRFDGPRIHEEGFHQSEPQNYHKDWSHDPDERSQLALEWFRFIWYMAMANDPMPFSELKVSINLIVHSTIYRTSSYHPVCLFHNKFWKFFPWSQIGVAAQSQQLPAVSLSRSCCRWVIRRVLPSLSCAAAGLRFTRRVSSSPTRRGKKQRVVCGEAKQQFSLHHGSLDCYFVCCGCSSLAKT